MPRVFVNTYTRARTLLEWHYINFVSHPMSHAACSVVKLWCSYRYRAWLSERVCVGKGDFTIFSQRTRKDLIAGIHVKKKFCFLKNWCFGHSWPCRVSRATTQYGYLLTANRRYIQEISLPFSPCLGLDQGSLTTLALFTFPLVSSTFCVRDRVSSLTDTRISLLTLKSQKTRRLNRLFTIGTSYLATTNLFARKELPLT